MRTASSGGFVTTKALANYGNETLNSNVAAKAWLYNQDKANLTINGELSIGQGLKTAACSILTPLAQPRMSITEHRVALSLISYR